MKIKSAWIVILFVIATPLWAQSVQKPQQQQPPANITAPEPKTPQSRYSLTVSSTIFQDLQSKITLSVVVPHNFRALETAVQASKSHIIEFIPENDEKTNWSQLITLQILSNKNLTASQYTELVKTETATKVKELQILENDTKTIDKYQMSTLAVTYEHNDRREIVYMRYFSSQTHLTGIQYAKLLKGNEKPQDVLPKMVEYVDHISSITVKPVTNPNLLKVENQPVNWKVKDE